MTTPLDLAAAAADTSPLSHPLVLGAAAGAAVLHALWNVMAKAMKDQVMAFWLINVTAAVFGAVTLAIVGLPAKAAWPYVAASLVIHVGYNTTLLNSYRFGDVGQVYPLARGMAPLLVAVGAAVFAGEALSGGQVAGVGVVAVGLASLVWVRGGIAGGDRKAVGLALATGLAIASYSVVDGIGVRHAGGSLSYAAAIFLTQGVVVAAGLSARRRRILPGVPDRTWALGVLGGALSVTAYSLVLWAQTRADLAVVSALRETSVVVAALLGAFLLHEGNRRRRLLSALVVLFGTVLIVAT